MKEIKEYSLLPHNTFGMDVKASVFVEYGSVAELKAILSNKDYLKPSWLHIGGGSNLLFTADYEGVFAGKENHWQNVHRTHRSSPCCPHSPAYLQNQWLPTSTTPSNVQNNIS